MLCYNFQTKMLNYRLLQILILSLFIAPLNSLADEGENVGVEVSAGRPVIESSVDTFAQPISQLRFDPRVDVQSRNLTEAQGDVTIRGGVFENSGAQIGSTSLLDPQTGHYLFEIPIAPSMLSPSRILTGFENSLSGLNATVGTVKYDWAPIRDGGSISLGAGTYDLNRQSISSGLSNIFQGDVGNFGLDVDLSRSESDGSREGGDNQFSRGAIRGQLKSVDAQTDVFFGHQEKEFSWPYLYALKELHSVISSPGIESEDLRTQMFMVGHKHTYGSQAGTSEANTSQASTSQAAEMSFFELGYSNRRNNDDYELDISRPGLFNPFEHETRLWSATANGLHHFSCSPFQMRYTAQFMSDNIKSTSLNFGKFNSQNRSKISAVPGVNFDVGQDWSALAEAGMSLDESNRYSSAAAPLSRVTLSKNQESRVYKIYFDASGAVQNPGYTALASNSSAGLFRGNADLARERTNNFEVGSSLSEDDLSVQAALFHRDTNNLTDWVYDRSIRPFASRSAANVDLKTNGAEFLGSYNWTLITFSGSYSLLNRQSSYKGTTADASFYALNYPLHRVTAGLVVHPTQEVDFRANTEWRKQEANSLRSSADTTYTLTSLAATWKPLALPGFSFALLADNITKENFEEIPGVPGVGRTVAGVATWSW